MTRFPSLLVIALLLFTTFASADVLFYGGDFNPKFWYADSLSNENDASVHGNPYGSAVYQNFVIPSGQTWNITALFSNDIMTLTPSSAYWEIRSGLSEGNGGTLLSSGAGSDSYQLKGAFDEYTNTVSGLSLALGPGLYWFTVVPEAPGQVGRSSNTNTFGQNSVGTQISDEQYINSPFLHYDFTNADNLSIFPRFSDGVIGTVAPEPSSIVMLASGLMAITAVVRRRSR
jgi:hypothetical protein